MDVERGSRSSGGGESGLTAETDATRDLRVVGENIVELYSPHRPSAADLFEELHGYFDEEGCTRLVTSADRREVSSFRKLLRGHGSSTISGR